MADVYLNQKFIGACEDPTIFRDHIIQERRRGAISNLTNVYYDKDANEIFIENSKGRARRPLIVVENGISKVNETILKQLEKKEITFNDLLNQGVIEFLDAAEEENAFVAMNENDITKEHTHLEISPTTMFGFAGSLVPYANYSPGVRCSMGVKNQRQALGLYTANYELRIDTDVSVLQMPQKPIVQTIMNDIGHTDKHPMGQNIIVAVSPYDGYNMEDAIVINRSSIDRGFGRSTYFRPASSEETRYAGGLIDEVGVPDKEVKGYRSEKDYRYLEDDGIIYPGAQVAEGDIIIGKTSPPRFLAGVEEYNFTTSARRESSVGMLHGEAGTVDFVLVTENEEGNKLVRVRVRDQRIPEVGDKLTSRFGQKGIVGLIIPNEDMPFTASGIVPDLLFSPHAIPSRMTVSHLIEIVAGKTASLSGRYVDGTTFNAEDERDIRKELLSMGFRESGTETMYNGKTGEIFNVKIFIGNQYYLKLRHLVANKIQSRGRGPIQLLTRQPTEGRAKEGGLRLGEMEKDTLVAHGAALLLKERFDSDKTIVPICEECGMMAVYDEYKKKGFCPVCGENADISNIEISYAFKLLLDELKALCIQPQLKLKTKY